MMKKVISLVFGLLIGLAVWAQGTADTSASAKDSVSIGSHTEFSATKSADNVTKAQGDSAYMRNDYASAIQIYESLLKKGEAAEVYYNLGNSYYKADDIAKAILNYERALLLQPGNADIRANLEIARSKTIDKVVSVPDIFFVAWVDDSFVLLHQFMKKSQKTPLREIEEAKREFADLTERGLSNE